MSESKKFVERTIVADPNRFKSESSSYPQEKLTSYQRTTRREREEAKRKERREQSAPYSYTKIPLNSSSRKLSNDEEIALAGLRELNNKREISDVKRLLNITPSKPVPILSESTFSYTPSELDRSIMREEFKRSQPSSLNLDDDIDFGLDLDEKMEEKGGRKRRRKSKKLRRSSKKSRKPKRKTTRKMRSRH
jgi:hypothetical protein